MSLKCPDCTHRVDTGVDQTQYHCLIVMALMGLQDNRTLCYPIPLRKNPAKCEIDFANSKIKKNPKYQQFLKNARKLGH